MAIPTISTITPSAGLTRGGNIVEIHGTNFRTVPAPPSEGYLGGEAQQTILASFGGVASSWAHALSSTRAIARVPTWAGALTVTMPVDVSVRIANLNDDGIEIIGENVTVVEAYTYGLPSLVPERRLQAATGALVTTLRRHIFRNVQVIASRDYDDTPATAQRLIASLPALHIVGPTCRINRFDSVDYSPAEPTTRLDLTWQRQTRPVVVDLVYQILGWAQNPRHLNNMAQQVLLLFRQHPWLEITTDPTTPSAATERHQIEVEWENHPDFGPMAPQVDDVIGWRAGVLVRGVQLADEPAIIIEQGWTVETPTLDGDA